MTLTLILVNFSDEDTYQLMHGHSAQQSGRLQNPTERRHRHEGEVTSRNAPGLSCDLVRGKEWWPPTGCWERTERDLETWLTVVVVVIVILNVTLHLYELLLYFVISKLRSVENGGGQEGMVVVLTVSTGIYFNCREKIPKFHLLSVRPIMSSEILV